jgi:hypothetical protein
MTVKASGRLALMLATGLFVCCAAPSQAAEDADLATAASESETAGAPVVLNKYAKHGSHHWKRYAHRRFGKVAVKSSADRKADTSDAADHASAIPPSVADANARLMFANTPTGNAARAMSARANDILQAAAPEKPANAQPAADAPVVSPGQLNDVDRALRESAPPARTPSASPLAMASAEAPAAPVAPVMANSSEPSLWDQTTLIGKIFIGFGALLTMASAARMFMA